MMDPIELRFSSTEVQIPSEDWLGECSSEVTCLVGLLHCWYDFLMKGSEVILDVDLLLVVFNS